MSIREHLVIVLAGILLAALVCLVVFCAFIVFFALLGVLRQLETVAS